MRALAPSDRSRLALLTTLRATLRRHRWDHLRSRRARPPQVLRSCARHLSSLSVSATPCDHCRDERDLINRCAYLPLLVSFRLRKLQPALTTGFAMLTAPSDKVLSRLRSQNVPLCARSSLRLGFGNCACQRCAFGSAYMLRPGDSPCGPGSSAFRHARSASHIEAPVCSVPCAHLRRLPSIYRLLTTLRRLVLLCACPARLPSRLSKRSRLGLDALTCSFHCGRFMNLVLLSRFCPLHGQSSRWRRPSFRICTCPRCERMLVTLRFFLRMASLAKVSPHDPVTRVAMLPSVRVSPNSVGSDFPDRSFESLRARAS